MPTTTNKCKTASHSIDAILGLRAAAAAAVAVASQHLPQRTMTQPPFLHSTHTGMKKTMYFLNGNFATCVFFSSEMSEKQIQWFLINIYSQCNYFFTRM